MFRLFLPSAVVVLVTLTAYGRVRNAAVVVVSGGGTPVPVPFLWRGGSRHCARCRVQQWADGSAQPPLRRLLSVVHGFARLYHSLSVVLGCLKIGLSHCVLLLVAILMSLELCLGPKSKVSVFVARSRHALSAKSKVGVFMAHSRRTLGVKS
ncbi:hypothetical protein Nepgr_030183 [Nepenthes gracilis]|uniref:Secreted protein n=1 Tax=Nepenthes gracilis TaxID=150966 RepID=A0AAD3TE35_NEPGR|nr:hypothetical protein Nepgr_030183 [Nepenthes gracilis]